MSYHEAILEIAVIFFDLTLSIYLISRRKVNHITGAFRRLAIAVTVADICDVYKKLVTDLAARHRHSACRGRCRWLRKKPRLPPGGGAVASATAAAAARGRS